MLSFSFKILARNKTKQTLLARNPLFQEVLADVNLVDPLTKCSTWILCPCLLLLTTFSHNCPVGKVLLLPSSQSWDSIQSGFRDPLLNYSRVSASLTGEPRDGSSITLNTHSGKRPFLRQPVPEWSSGGSFPELLEVLIKVSKCCGYSWGQVYIMCDLAQF